MDGWVGGWMGGWVGDGRLTEAPEGARWSLRECTAAGRAAAEVGAGAKPDARMANSGRVNGRLTEAPEGARWSLNECAAAGRAAA